MPRAPGFSRVIDDDVLRLIFTGVTSGARDGSTRRAHVAHGDTVIDDGRKDAVVRHGRQRCPAKPSSGLSPGAEVLPRTLLTVPTWSNPRGRVRRRARAFAFLRTVFQASLRLGTFAVTTPNARPVTSPPSCSRVQRPPPPPTRQKPAGASLWVSRFEGARA